MLILLKRVYEKPVKQDGVRVLVERLWPRGISKERAQVDIWLKDIAPSTDLRKWFSHDPLKWKEFKIRYFAELGTQEALLMEIIARMNNEQVTFVYSSKEERFNNAVALKEYLEHDN
ncbi:MAG: DUF488 domain-containing protein [Nitrospirales bacterium]